MTRKLAELQRLNILPTGYIYDPQLRPVRDLLRRRVGLVHQRTALLLSSKSLYMRTTGQELKSNRLKALKPAEAGELYAHPANQLIASLQKEHIEQLDQSIGRIEKAVLVCARELPYYERLNTLPGVGRILGMTITMEVGDIQRFKTAGDFASYCRAVDARRTSNEQGKGWNNRKCGNKYLSWAFVEAANFARRYDERSRKWFDRKAAKTNRILGHQGAGVQAGQSGMARDGAPGGLRCGTSLWESRRQPGKRVGAKPLRTDWSRRLSFE